MCDEALTTEVMEYLRIKLSEMYVSGRLCWLNSRLIMAIIEQVATFCIGKISSHLEWASTMTKKLPLFIGPTKSTCFRGHGCSGRLGRKTGVADGLSVSVTLT